MREDQVAFLVELQVEIEELRRTLQDQDVSDPSVIVIVEQKLTATRGIWAALRRSTTQPPVEHPQHVGSY
jgi:hypothetical protein